MIDRCVNERYNKYVDTKKQVLIITDGTELIEHIAKSITSAFKDCTVKVCSGVTFAGTDLLKAKIFFIGCENPDPVSFNYLSKLLGHINLANRHCGVFSTNDKALKYLCGLLKDCEAKIEEPLLVQAGNIDSDVLNKYLGKFI